MTATAWTWPTLADAARRAVLNGPTPVVGALDLDVCPAALLADADRLLSDEERARRDDFHRPQDARRFAAARLALRVVLGARTDLPPADIEIARAPGGKPRLARREAPRFNVSHSGPALLVALHARHAVGVDVERAEPPVDVGPLIPLVLTDREAAALPAGPPEARSWAFMRYWTIKEAVLKASGEGLARSLLAVEVDLAGAEPRLRLQPDDHAGLGQWSVRAWRHGAYAAAVAWVVAE